MLSPWLNIAQHNNNWITSVYRKNTFSGLGIHFLSNSFNLFKINAIKTLIHKAYYLSSTYMLFHEEIKFLEFFFCQQWLPVTYISKFLQFFSSIRFFPINLKYLRLPSKSSIFRYLTMVMRVNMKLTISQRNCLAYFRIYSLSHAVLKNNYNISNFF